LGFGFSVGLGFGFSVGLGFGFSVGLGFGFSVGLGFGFSVGLASNVFFVGSCWVSASCISVKVKLRLCHT
jgi:hypothetical protein